MLVYTPSKIILTQNLVSVKLLNFPTFLFIKEKKLAYAEEIINHKVQILYLYVGERRSAGE